MYVCVCVRVREGERGERGRERVKLILPCSGFTECPRKSLMTRDHECLYPPLGTTI